jgi:Zn-finger nucleic acid-binding protein
MRRIQAQEIVAEHIELICPRCKGKYVPKTVDEIEVCPGCKTYLDSISLKVTKGNLLLAPKAKLSPYAHHHRGWRNIGGKRIWFPNRMEANYYRMHLWQKEKKIIANFEYQPEPFDFRPYGYSKGTVTYRLDFLVVPQRESAFYEELKGHIGRDHKTKMNRMRKCFPSVFVKLITYQDYKETERQVSMIIKGWEK